jgi:hypothetical protein
MKKLEDDPNLLNRVMDRVHRTQEIATGKNRSNIF